MGTARLRSWLLLLADPAGVAGRLPEHRLPIQRWARLLRLADDHGVGGAVTTNLSRLIADQGADRVLAGPRGSADGRAWLKAALTSARRRWVQRAARSLVLRRRADELMAELAARRVPGVLLKGADFADRLYSDPCHRTFQDVDVLVPREAFREAREVLAELGYRPAAPPQTKHVTGYGQESWDRADQAACTVELHWDLINVPSQRRLTSVAYGDLDLEQAERAGRGVVRPSACAVLLIAAVHAAVSHQFDRLQLLCDIRQACRGEAGRIDSRRLSEMARRTGSGAALATSLELVERVFGDAPSGAMRRALNGRPSVPGLRYLISLHTILEPTAPLSVLRRRCLRELLKRAA